MTNLKKKISIPILLFSITILSVYFVHEQYFSLGDFYILPIVTIFSSGCTLFLHVFKTKQYPRKNLIVLILLMYVFLSVTLYGYYAFDVVASYILIFSLFYFVTIHDYTLKDIRFLLFCYILSAVILTCILFVQLRMPYLGRMRFSVYYSETEYYDANFLGSYLLLPALFSFYFAWIKPIKKGRVLMCLFNLLLLAAVLYTGSRAAMLGLLIGLSPVLFRFLDNKKMLLILLFLVFIVSIFLPDELKERLFLNSYDDGSQSRRTDDWMYGLMAIMQCPLGGSGFSSTSTIIYRLFHVNITAHNSFLAMFMNFGLLGSIPLLYLMIKPLIRFRNSFLGIYLISFYGAFIFNITIIEALTSFVFIIPFIIFFIITQNKSVDIC